MSSAHLVRQGGISTLRAGGRAAAAPLPAGFSDADESMQSGLEVNSSARNYLGWIEELCAPHLGGRVLEVGSGRGDLTAAFAEGRQLVATDCSEQNLRHLEARFAGSPNISVEPLDAARFEPGEPFDSVVMVNVLEHISGDVKALERLRSGLAPGGRAIIYVPAFMALYSPWDAKIGHFRRYTKASLAETVEAAGLRITDLRYVNALGAGVWLTFCRLLRQEPAQSWVVRSWDRLAIPVLHGLERRVTPPFGISVFCVAERLAA